MDWQIVAAIAVAVIGSGGLGGALGAYWQFRVLSTRQTTDTWATAQKEKRDNFEAIVETLQAEMKRLKEEAERERELRGEADTKSERFRIELAEHRGATDARIGQLERENVALTHKVVALESRLCPYELGTCPRRPQEVVVGG